MNNTRCSTSSPAACTKAVKDQGIRDTHTAVHRYLEASKYEKPAVRMERIVNFDIDITVAACGDKEKVGLRKRPTQEETDYKLIPDDGLSTGSD